MGAFTEKGDVRVKKSLSATGTGEANSKEKCQGKRVA